MDSHFLSPPTTKQTMPDSDNTFHLPPPAQFTTADDPLKNLATIQTRVDSLSQILSNSVNANTLLPKPQSDTITAELISAIHHIIINGAALLASSHQGSHHPNPNPSRSDGEDFEIVELDVMEITADHSHTCKVCGKGFKRDANLRMHMRAHGDKFKTLESLSKPTQNKNNNIKISDNGGGRKTRFSCPFVGCNRNKKHKDFRPLKSAVCVKNHFKRFHCPKMFSCNRCNKKSFSVLSDLKSHMKHCSVVAEIKEEEEEKKWEYCSCGLRFLNKDELFGHVSLSHGHMPAAGNCNFNDNIVGVEENEDEIDNNNYYNQGFQFDGFVGDDDQFLQEMGLWSSVEDLVNFLSSS